MSDLCISFDSANHGASHACAMQGSRPFRMLVTNPSRQNAPMPISPELQARIDALPDEHLRANITRRLNRNWPRTKSSEQIFEDMLAHHEEVMAERAKWRQWRDDEVTAFVEYFKQQLPDDYAEYLRQELENNQIESDLSWRVRRLVDKWMPDLAYADNGNLVSKVRDHVRLKVRGMREEGT
jgi:DNA-binding ferritin-like protein (Dps family)